MTQRPAPPSRFRRRALIVLGLAIAALFVWAVLRGIELRQVGAELARVNPLALAATALATLLAWTTMALRSAVLFAPLHRFALLRLLRGILVTCAGNMVLPLRAGELLRVAYLARHGSLAASTTLAVVGVERLLDVLCMTLLFFAVLPLAVMPLPRTTVFVGVGVATLLLLAGAIFCARRPRTIVAIARGSTRLLGARLSGLVGDKVALFADGLSSLRSAWAVAGAFGVSLVFWLGQLSVFRLVLWACDLHLPWYAPGVVLAFVTLGIALPAAPGFVGTFHYFAQWALKLLGAPPSRALSAAIVAHGVGVGCALLYSMVLLGPELLRGELGRRAPVP